MYNPIKSRLVRFLAWTFHVRFVFFSNRPENCNTDISEGAIGNMPKVCLYYQSEKADAKDPLIKGRQAIQEIEQDATVQHHLLTKPYVGLWREFREQLGFHLPWMLHIHVHGLPPAVAGSAGAKKPAQMVFADQDVSYQTFFEALNSHNLSMRELRPPSNPICIVLLAVCHSFSAIDEIFRKCKDIQVVIAANSGEATGELNQDNLANFCRLFYKFLVAPKKTIHNAFVQACGKDLLVLKCRSTELENVTFLDLMKGDSKPDSSLLSGPSSLDHVPQANAFENWAKTYLRLHIYDQLTTVVNMLAKHFYDRRKYVEPNIFTTICGDY